jgi:hypothetical protein
MRKTLLFFLICLLSTVVVCGQQSNTTALKTALQVKLDEWHKAGSFPGATLGVVRTRFENAIKAKEPSFKLVSKLVRNNQQEKFHRQPHR